MNKAGTNDPPTTPRPPTPQRPQQPDLEARLTAAVREADVAFEKVGGSSRHYVRDCLLPALAEAKLALVEVTE